MLKKILLTKLHISEIQAHLCALLVITKLSPHLVAVYAISKIAIKKDSKYHSDVMIHKHRSSQANF